MALAQRGGQHNFSGPLAVGLRPDSQPESVGVVSLAQSHNTIGNPSTIAEEVAEDMTMSMFDSVLSPPHSRSLADGAETMADAEEVASLRAEIEQLQAQLGSARSDLEFAALKEEELEKRHHLAQETISKLREQNESLAKQVQSVNGELQELEQVQQDNAARRDNSLEEECLGLRDRVSSLEADLADARRELSERKDVCSTQPTLELAGDSSEETPLLSAAYQQISVLNTQLAHLYTELTLARTEVQNLKSEQADQTPSQPRAIGGDVAADIQKQSQQIADLLSDIKHLQLDLEYHQQKLDQMLEEKQKMMKDLKKTQSELLDSRQQIEERDQMLKHREVDLAHLKEELKRPCTSGGGPSAEDDSGMLVALRSEAAAKDSALIVSHYELHKEKLMRDRLEQKNLKLMERMQKLMLVVETMRKDNIGLERNLATKDKLYEEKIIQLAQVTQKARQLQKQVKGTKGHTQKEKGQKGTVLELEAPTAQGLPLLQSQRSIDSARGGNRSGVSTPRTPRAPTTPYLSR